MRKGWLLFFIFLLGIPIVSAQTPGFLQDGMEQFIGGLQELGTPIFEFLLNTSSYDDFFFAKILLILLIFIVILSVLKKVDLFKEQKGIPPLVAVIISILSVRYMPEDFVGGVLLPYSTLGIAITTFIPLLVYFWFVHNSVQGGFGRRMAWILYGIVFLLVWVSRPVEQISSGSNWLYVLGFLAVLLAFFFDKSVHGYFKLEDIKKFERSAKTSRIANLKDELARLLNSPGYPDDKDIKQRTDTIRRQLKKLGASADAMY